MTTEIELLRQMYLDDLSKTVNFGGRDRPRVAYPPKWNSKPPLIGLADTVSEPIQMTPENIKKTFVWSDQHFSHKNIIEFSGRPYVNVDEMNEALIANYNDYVSDDDICLWVGDVGFCSTTKINEILDRCNGYKILIIGNHDFNREKLRKLKFDETHLIYQIDVPNASLVFTHYPMDNITLPWVNIHGHLHAFPKFDTGNTLHYNVNCEAHNFRPVQLTEVIKVAKMRLIAAGM